MHVTEIVKNKMKEGVPTFSVEIIPPRNGALLSDILRKVDALLAVEPDFISITRGAGGSLRGGTVPIAYLVKTKFNVETIAHLTCLDTPIDELENILMDHRYLEIDNILALRGDPPRDASDDYAKVRGAGFHRYAKDLVRQICRMNEEKYLKRKSDNKIYKTTANDEFRKGAPSNLCISVAGHPDGHPECPDREEALLHLKQKVDEGAELIFTQMVFSAKTYADFVKKARAIGISVPVIPGVRPITKYKQIAHIESFFLVPVPDGFKKELKSEDENYVREKGIELTARLSVDLLKSGAPGIHFFLMNDIESGRVLIKKIKEFM